MPVAFTHLLAVRVEEVSEVNDVGMRDQSHDLKFTVLESLVLQHLLDRHILRLAAHGPLDESGLEHDTERSVTDDFAVRILDLALLARLAIAREHRSYLGALQPSSRSSDRPCSDHRGLYGASAGSTLARQCGESRSDDDAPCIRDVINWYPVVQLEA